MCITILIATEFIDADPTEFYCQSDVNAKPSDNTTDTTRNQQITIYLTGLSVALVALVVAVLVHQLAI